MQFTDYFHHILICSMKRFFVGGLLNLQFLIVVAVKGVKSISVVNYHFKQLPLQRSLLIYFAQFAQKINLKLYYFKKKIYICNSRPQYRSPVGDCVAGCRHFWKSVY